VRKIREITAEEEKFRTEALILGNPNQRMIKRDFVEPEPIGTIVLLPFRIVGYNRDCDGSALAHLAALDNTLDTTGWSDGCIGLYPSVGMVVEEKEYLEMVAKIK